MAVDDFEYPDGAEEAQEMETENEMDPASMGPQKEGEEREVFKEGGLKKLLVKTGAGWETPDTGHEVKVHYTGTFLDGTKFDSSHDRGDPFTFTLGQGEVINGWDKGIGTMKKGEQSIFTIAPEYAYGEAGAPPSIPANSTLKFDVQLISWASVKDICKEGGIFKKILKDGEEWETTKDADDVTVKHIWKFGALLGALVSIWVALLLSPNLPHSYALLLPYLPVYAVVALGCYGLGAVGYGLMVFPTCPNEAVLLQKDIDEARAFYKDKDVDIGPY